MDKTNSQKKQARTAGAFYLTVFATGIFAKFIVRGNIVVSGDAQQTAENIISNELLFRLGFVSDLLMLAAYFMLPLILYRLLKHVNIDYARLMVLCVMVAVSIMCLNMLNHLAALLLLNGSYILSAFSNEQVEALAMFFLKLHSNGYIIAQIFFGLWLFPLGYLVLKSGYFPRILGILLMIGSACYLMDFFNFFLLTELNEKITPILTAPSDLAELLFSLWLVIVGVRKPK